MRSETLHRLDRRDRAGVRLDVPLVPLAILFEEVLGEQRDVLDALGDERDPAVGHGGQVDLGQRGPPVPGQEERVALGDTLPAGLTATAISGTGWTCVLATLSCTRGNALAVTQPWFQFSNLRDFPTPTVNVSATIYAPGGWIVRTDENGKTWETYAVGFRNAYDLAFNPHGELFSFDSDMEWDTGTPRYRPTRLIALLSPT